MSNLTFLYKKLKWPDSCHVTFDIITGNVKSIRYVRGMPKVDIFNKNKAKSANGRFNSFTKKKINHDMI